MATNFTIGKKIGLGFASVLVLTALLGGIGVYQMIQVDVGLMDMANVHGPLGSAISEVDAGSYDIFLHATLYTAHKEESLLEEFSTRCNEVKQSIETAKTIVNQDEDLVGMGWLTNIDDIDTTREVFVKSCNDLLNVVKDSSSSEENITAAADAAAAAFKPYMVNIDSFLETNNEETGRVSSSAEIAADRAKFWLVTISIAAVLVGSSLAFFIARGVIRALKKIINALTEGSEQVSSASGQVSAASQSLAEGSTEQAAGLEETSSSLEEMASMTKQNADNAQQANTLASEARKAADTGTESMTRMNEAINDIQKSSDETAKIIKVIDEIAFQTNLLAL
ncbi:MAG: HAMP domain-containing methyl-accepting chemotaxis protein, partial [Planctomycetota bacterium]